MTNPLLVSGLVFVEMSEEIRPQDDLFHYVNERWIERTAIPSDKSSYGTFMILDEGAERAVRAIVEEAQSASEGGELRKCGDLYTSFLDEARIEELGAEPLRGRLEDVARVESIVQLLRTVGDLQRRGLAGFYQVFVDSDPGNPERYLAFFEQGGISLPDESYYREAHFASVRDAFVGHVRRMFELAGLDEPERRAKRVFDLETEIARRHWDNVASRDSEKTYNPVEWRVASDLFDGGVSGT